jgi:hypothetical protein
MSHVTSTTEAVDITLLRNLWIRLPTDAPSYCRRALTSTTQLEKPQLAKRLIKEQTVSP